MYEFTHHSFHLSAYLDTFFPWFLDESIFTSIQNAYRNPLKRSKFFYKKPFCLLWKVLFSFGRGQNLPSVVQNILPEQGKRTWNIEKMLKALFSLCRSVSPTTSLLPVSPTASQLPGPASRLRAPGRPGQQQQQSQRGVPVPATLSGLPAYQKRTSLDGDSTPRRYARFIFIFFLEEKILCVGTATEWR